MGLWVIPEVVLISGGGLLCLEAHSPAAQATHRPPGLGVAKPGPGGGESQVLSGKPS